VAVQRDFLRNPFVHPPEMRASVTLVLQRYATCRAPSVASPPETARPARIDPASIGLTGFPRGTRLSKQVGRIRCARSALPLSIDPSSKTSRIPEIIIDESLAARPKEKTMKSLFRKTAVSMCVLSITALAGTWVQAQGDRAPERGFPGEQLGRPVEVPQGGAPIQGGQVPCPRPYTLHLTATPGQVDVSALLPGHAYQGVGGTQVNTWSGYTFKFPKPQHCCQAMSARLTVTFKALQGGPHGSASSANDTWGVTIGGAVVAGSSAQIYYPSLPASQSVPTGYQVNKTFTVTDFHALVPGSLGFYAQDDTGIVSATLDITGCCLTIE
jgi:hypothetical protein